MPTISTSFFNKQSRLTGTEYSNVYSVPVSSGTVQATIDATDITAANQEVTIGVEVSRDNGVTWAHYASMTVKGAPVRTGKPGDDPNKPTQTVNFEFTVPVKVRSYCTVLNGPLNFSVAGTLIYA